MSETPQRVRLVCPSYTWGDALNATGVLVKRCRGKFCKTNDGEAVYHVFDLSSGSHHTYVDEEAAYVQAQELSHAGNADF